MSQNTAINVESISFAVDEVNNNIRDAGLAEVGMRSASMSKVSDIAVELI